MNQNGWRHIASACGLVVVLVLLGGDVDGADVGGAGAAVAVLLTVPADAGDAG